MALVASAPKHAVIAEMVVYDLTGSDGADLTITHNLGRVPKAIISPIGTSATINATVVSVSATTVVVNVTTAGAATLYLLLTGA